MTVLEARRLERSAARRDKQEADEAPLPGPAQLTRAHGPAPRGLSALICAIARPITGRDYRRGRMRPRPQPAQPEE